MTDQFACLAVETATDVCTVAAANAGEVHIVELPDPRASVRDIYRSIDRVVSEVGLGLAELDCIAFGAGPGSLPVFGSPPPWRNLWPSGSICLYAGCLAWRCWRPVPDSGMTWIVSLPVSMRAKGRRISASTSLLRMEQSAA